MVESQPPPAVDPNQMAATNAPTQPPGQYNYWLAAQDYTPEIDVIKGLLEGKIQTLKPDGSRVWEYPRLWVPKADHPKGGSWFEVVEPVCTPEGQREILSFVSARLQVGTVLSNMTAERMLFITEQDLYVLWKMCYLNMRRWQIDPTRFKSLIITLGDRIEMARRRAVDNEERGIVGKVVSVFQSISGNSNQQGKFPSISGMYGRGAQPKF